MAVQMFILGFHLLLTRAAGTDQNISEHDPKRPIERLNCASPDFHTSSLTEETGIKLSLESESNPKWLSFHRGEGGWQSWLAGARARAVGCGLWVVAVGSGSEGKRSFYM